MTTQRETLEWPATQEVFRRAFRSSFAYSIASIGEDGAPHVTPIASVMLTEPGRGVFFDIFASQLGRNITNDPRVCVMAVDSSKRFWLKSLASGRFAAPPALRLVGTAGPRRDATLEEQQRWLHRVRKVRSLKGHQLLWGGPARVRDLTFTEALPVRLGAMTRTLET
ncbi:MAG TPA: pyridoxamine 5'-phosphate oxidase family protein [Actinobacteria bacterium]|nr:pyridoxamine 5'-phosphate oxidase family protein [Actinomycetota bacterium]